MYKFKMTLALLATSLLVVACGEGFRSLKVNSNSDQTRSDLGQQTQGVGQNNTVNTLNNPLSIIHQITEQQTPQLWPETANDPFVRLQDGRILADSIKGLEIGFLKPNSATSNSNQVLVVVQLALGCDSGNIKGLTIERLIDFSYLKTNANRINDLGSRTPVDAGGRSETYSFKMACADARCGTAVLYITKQNEYVGTSTIERSSVAIYLQEKAPGWLVPRVNSSLSADSRYAVVGEFSNYSVQCKGSNTNSGQAPSNNGFEAIEEGPEGGNSGSNNGASELPDFNIPI